MFKTRRISSESLFFVLPLHPSLCLPVLSSLPPHPSRRLFSTTQIFHPHFLKKMPFIEKVDKTVPSTKPVSVREAIPAILVVAFAGELSSNETSLFEFITESSVLSDCVAAFLPSLTPPFPNAHQVLVVSCMVSIKLIWCSNQSIG